MTKGSKPMMMMLVLCMVALAVFTCGGCNKPKNEEGAATGSGASAGQPPAAEAPKPTAVEEKSAGTEAEHKGSIVAIRTAKGMITVELFDKQAPITAGNFLLLTESGFYNGLKFHRVVPDFVIQGGDPKGTGAGGPGFTIPDEVTPELKHDRGMLSMAKTALPDTGGSQFFIVIGPRETVQHLDMKHAVFGHVVEGMDVAMKIQAGDVMEKVSVVAESKDAAAAKEAATKARVKD